VGRRVLEHAYGPGISFWGLERGAAHSKVPFHSDAWRAGRCAGEGPDHGSLAKMDGTVSSN
jgi:hypothetical protein